MRKKIVRYTLLALVAILMISALTGCGFAPATSMKPDKLTSQTKSGYANLMGEVNVGQGSASVSHFMPVYTASGISGNKLCVVWKGAISGADPTGKYQISHSELEDFLWTTPLRSNVDYGLGADSDTTFFRTMAIMMYDSVFGENYAAEKDHFCHDDKWVAFKIAPKDVLSKSLQLTAEALTLNDTVSLTAGSNGGNNVTPKNNNLDHNVNIQAGEGGGGSAATTTQPGVHKALSGVVATIEGIAMAILVAMWCIEFISQVVAERFTPETVLKTLMQLMCGILVVANANVLVAAFAQTGNALSETIGKNINPVIDNSFKTAIENELANGITSFNIARDFGIFTLGIGTIWVDLGAIKVILFLIAPVFVQLMCAYKIISRMIMRMLELTVRVTLAPIPLSFSAQRGFSPDTIRYLRKCLACALEPALMFIGIACVGTIEEILRTIVGAGNLDGTPGMLVGAITTTMTYLILSAYLSSTKNLAQDVIAG